MAEQGQSAVTRILERAARGVAFVSLVFSLVVLVLLVMGHARAKRLAPHDFPEIQAMIRDHQANESDAELVGRIRAVDLLVRQGYFAGRSFLRIGTRLLLAGTVVLAVSLHICLALRRKRPAPGRFTGEEDPLPVSARARLALSAASAAFVAVAVVLLLIMKSPLDKVSAGRETRGGASGGTAGRKLGAAQSQAEMLANWPNFRGPYGTGIATAAGAPPTEWDAKTSVNIAWKTEVPLPGSSSPIVWTNRLFITGADAQRREVFCLDTDTGAILWRSEAPPGKRGEVPTVSDDTGYAAPSPATDGQRVFAIFATGDIVCLDFDGKKAWARSLGVPKNHYGHSSSLITHEDLLIVQYDQDNGARVMAFECATGKEAWRTDREQISWASPICVNTGSRFELILTCCESVNSYDPEIGLELWGLKCLGGEVGPSAAFENGMVFAANDTAKAVGVRIGGNDGPVDPEIVWEYDENLPDVSSPLAASNRVFLASSSGTVTCLDAGTGRKVWEHEFDEGFYASPILAGGLVYLMDTKGTARIFRIADAYEAAGEGRLHEDAVATPAFVKDRIFIRGSKYLYCVGKTDAAGFGLSVDPMQGMPK